jgi:hypothetical protein
MGFPAVQSVIMKFKAENVQNSTIKFKFARVDVNE